MTDERNPLIPPLGSTSEFPNIPPDHHADGRGAAFGFISVYQNLHGVLPQERAIIKIIGDKALIDIGGPQSAGENNDDRHGTLLVRDKNNVVTIILDGKAGHISISGDIVLSEPDNPLKKRVEITRENGALTLLNSATKPIITANAEEGQLSIGGADKSGQIIVRNRFGAQVFSLEGDSGDVRFGGGGYPGKLVLQINDNKPIVQLDALSGSIKIGSQDQPGRLTLEVADGEPTIQLNAESGKATLGSNGRAGILLVLDASGDPTFHLDGTSATAKLGNTVETGKIVLENIHTTKTVEIDGQTAIAVIGSEGQAGQLSVMDEFGEKRVDINASSQQDILVDVSGKLRVQDLEVVGSITSEVIEQLSRRLKSLEDLTSKKFAELDERLNTLEIIMTAQLAEISAYLQNDGVIHEEIKAIRKSLLDINAVTNKAEATLDSHGQLIRERLVRRMDEVVEGLVDDLTELTLKDLGV